jgi:hypothetical protein
VCLQKAISHVCWNRYIHFLLSQPVSFISVLAALSFRMCLCLSCVYFPSGFSHQNYVFIPDDYQACWIPRPRCFDRSNYVGVNSSPCKCFAQLSLSTWHCRSHVPTFHLSHLCGPSSVITELQGERALLREVTIARNLSLIELLFAFILSKCKCYWIFCLVVSSMSIFKCHCPCAASQTLHVASLTQVQNVHISVSFRQSQHVAKNINLLKPRGN